MARQALWLWVFLLVGAAPARTQSSEQVSEAMRKAGAFAPDPCGAFPDFPDLGSEEDTIYNGAVKVTLETLNSAPSALSPGKIAEDALERIVAQSTKDNQAWSSENRFHAQVTALDRLLVLKLGFRSDERWFALGFATPYGKTSSSWFQLGQDEVLRSGNSSISIYPIHSGPSGVARFLASAFWTGCAGSSGVSYELREWQPYQAFLSTTLSQAGARGMDPQPGPVSKANPFPTIGKLKTEGSRIELPYCYFSPIDTWDNPDLCVADTYDVSSDEPRFLSRLVNRPDMFALASALTYAAAHDLRALQAYCATPAVAAQILRGVPFLDLTVEDQRMAPGVENVETGAGRFVLLKRKRGWVVAGWKPS